MGVLEKVLDVFSGLGTWLVETIPTFEALFYNASTGLTFMGTLAVAGLGIGVVFLLIGVIQKFLKFRG